MTSRHLIHAACFCFAAPLCACGAAGANVSEATQASQVQALEAAENEDEDLPTGTEAKVRSRYNDLKAAGALDDRNWRLNTAPPDQKYVEIVLQGDATAGTVTDGYYITALIPMDDTQGVHRFFINRVGGVSGWQFLAGPFQIDSKTMALRANAAQADGDVANTLLINEQNAGQVMQVAAGATVVAEMRSNPSTGYTWMVAAPTTLGQPVQQYVADQPQQPGSGGVDRFTWNSVGASAVAGQVYSVRFVYKRTWEDQAARDFTIQLQVK